MTNDTKLNALMMLLNDLQSWNDTGTLEGKTAEDVAIEVMALVTKAEKAMAA